VSAASETTAPAGSVLVATKLYVPTLRPGMVARGELVARLVEAGDRKLVLVCAPAGWGKTSVLSEWHSAPEESRPFAWVSLDPSDGDPVRFWSYVIGALRTVAPQVGETAVAALPNAPNDVVEAVLPSLINELATTERRLVLVLDDYHFVRDESIHAALAFLLRHLPPTVQVAVTSRADPPLPLGSMRAAGEVLEIRAAQLRFNDREAEELLNGSLALELEPPEVALLQERTEGWAAGLQLAGLSLREQDDPRVFVHAFAGDDRQIVDYLHEVIAGQSAPLREFLLQTSILETAVRYPLRCRHRHVGRARPPGGDPALEPVPGAARQPWALVPQPPSVSRPAATRARARRARARPGAAPARVRVAPVGGRVRRCDRTCDGGRRRRRGM
jgi:LuxR family maltose regulon positive regulatory protein